MKALRAIKAFIQSLWLSVLIRLDVISMKQAAREKDRDQFIRDHAHELGEDYAAEFYDKYN